MKIAIIGPGAMGCLFAALLSRNSNNEVWLLDKNHKRAKLLETKGIRVEGRTKIKTRPGKVRVTTNPKIIGICDAVIVSVKAYDTFLSVKNAKPCISTGTIVLTLQNGLGNIESIKKAVGRRFEKNVTGGITTQASTHLGIGNIRHAGKGETAIDQLPSMKQNVNKLVKLLNSSGIETKISKDISSLIWSKLIINSAINPLGTIFSLNNGGILRNKLLKDILCSIANESASVAKSLGVKLLYQDAGKKAVEVCRATKNNFNSMLQDTINGRRTEIDYINGAVVKYAGKAGAQSLLNKIMFLIVKKIENKV